MVFYSSLHSERVRSDQDLAHTPAVPNMAYRPLGEAEWRSGRIEEDLELSIIASFCVGSPFTSVLVDLVNYVDIQTT